MNTVVKISIYFVLDVQVEPTMRKGWSFHLQKSALNFASQGSIPGWRNFSFLLHLEFSSFWMSPVAYYALITIKLTLQLRSTHHAPMQWHFWSKLNKDRNPSTLWKMELGWKSRNKTSKLLLPQWRVRPFICMPLMTSLPKKPRGSAPHLSACSPSESVSLLK